MLIGAGLLAAMAVAAEIAAAEPVRLDFDTTPPSDWIVNDCDSDGTGTVAGGILTIDSPSCFEYILNDPNAPWYTTVSNARGWAIETRLRLAAVSGGGTSCEPDNGVRIWAHDHSTLLQVGFAPGGVCLLYPDQLSYAMDTTSAFHTYRVEMKALRVRILVDGTVRIDHVLSAAQPDATEVLYFGDGVGGTPSRSFWDYFEYDTFADNLCFGQASTIVGTAGNDMLSGTAGPDVISGLGGADTISGLGGDDLICGGAGNDTLLGGDNNDKLQGAGGSDSLSSNAGDDVLIGGPGDDELAGGIGRDRASFSSALRAIMASLATGTASGAGADSLAGLEDLYGSLFADTLTGDGGPNVLRGRQGDDLLDGAGGADTLYGDAGSDTCRNGETVVSC